MMRPLILTYAHWECGCYIVVDETGFVRFRHPCVYTTHAPKENTDGAVVVHGEDGRKNCPGCESVNAKRYRH